MVSLEKALDRAAKHVGNPLFERLPIETRIELMFSRIAYYSGEGNSVNYPFSIDKFRLEVLGDKDEYPIPEEATGFGGVFTVVANPDTYPLERVREIRQLTAPNLNLTQDGSDVPVYGGIGDRALRWSTSGVGKNQKIKIYPRNAIDDLLVYYRSLPNQDALLADVVELPDQFQLGLIPIAAAVSWIPFCWWPGMGPDEVRMQRAELRDESLSGSPANLLLKEEELFQKRIWMPDNVQPEANVDGFGSMLRPYRRSSR